MIVRSSSFQLVFRRSTPKREILTKGLKENAALPPGKTAFLIMPHRNPHLRNSGKAYEHIANGISIAENREIYSGDLLYFL